MNQETITITQDQYHLIINALNELRNRCIRENIDTTDVEDALLELIGQHEKNKNMEMNYDAR